MPAPAIEVRDLVVRYGTKVAVDGVSFDARAGQIVALLGPNGAGKTSTVEVLEGYRVPTRGIVRVLGLDPRTHHKELSGRIGVMLQRGGVYPTMSPREAVRLFARYYDQSEEPEGLLYRVGLVDVAATPWRQLSGGEQQRLSLALALVGRPWVAFLDEPSAGVDPQGRLAIREVISDLRAAGTCVLLTTHEMQEAERLADRIVILDHGRVVADGTPSQLVTDEGGKGIRFAATGGLDTQALAAALAATVEVVRPGEFLVHADATPATIAALTAWLAERDITLTDLQLGRERLEDVFLRLTADTPAEAGDVAEPVPVGDDPTLVLPITRRRRRTVTPGGRGPGATDPQTSPEASEASSPSAGDEAAPTTAESIASEGER
ncbi:MAG TPA: ABC transporter ATP-binding protein [Acidimicrobiales bacterium]|nr:ABC transporter ATP-binding protein [Acidimicrobiales bacterium]